MRIFPYAIALLEFGAACVYAYYRERALAVVWLCYAIATMALGGIK